MNSRGLGHQQSWIIMTKKVPVKHDFGETFDREKFDGESSGKGEWNNLVNRLCKLQSHNIF